MKDTVQKKCHECGGNGKVMIHSDEIYERGSTYASHPFYKESGHQTCYTCRGAGIVNYKIQIVGE